MFARFYIVGILFLLFDLELSYIIISVKIPYYDNFTVYSRDILLLLGLVLAFGMIMEWKYSLVSKSGFRWI